MNMHKGIELPAAPESKSGYLARPNPASFEARGFFRFLMRRHRAIIAVWILAAAAVFALSMAQTPKYKAAALIMISVDQDKAFGTEQNANANQSPDSGIIDSQIVLLQSRKLIGQLVDRLKLVSDPAWNPALQLGEPPLNDEPAVTAANPSQVRRAVIDKVSRSIKARRVGLTSVIEISATSEKPSQSALMANTLAEIYFESQLQGRLSSVQKTSAWLGERLTGLKSQLEQKEAAVEKYRSSHGLLTAEGASLTERQITELQGSVIAAKADLAERQARYQQMQTLIRAGGSAETIAGAISSDTIRDLRSKEADLAARQADLEVRYGRLHPAVAKGRIELLGIQNQIRAEISRLSVNLENEVEVARARLSALQGNQSAVLGTMATNNEVMIKLRELERDAAATRTIYESFLGRFQTLSEAGTLNMTAAELAAEATRPLGPSSPNLPTALVFALGLGLFLGLAAGLAFEMRDDGSLDSADSVESWTGQPTIALIPVVRGGMLSLFSLGKSSPANYLVQKPLSAMAESFRSLRTSLFYSGSRRQSKVTAITSSVPDEGKTTVSLCLARLCAMSGQRVIILDCDLRRRSIGTTLNLDPKIGLLEVLLGEVRIEDAVLQDDATGLHILPAAIPTIMPEDIFGEDSMTDLLEDLRTRYDQVILDCPPVLAIAETRILAGLADQTVLVARHGKTQGRAAKLAAEKLVHSGAAVAGVVLNFVDSKLRMGASPNEIDYQKMYASYYAS